MKSKEIIRYLLLSLVILFSFAIPKLVINMEEKKLFSGMYVVNKKVPMSNNDNSKINIIEKIKSKYHNSSKYQVSVSDISQNIKEILISQNNEWIVKDKTNILNHVEELVKQNIVSNLFFENLQKEKEIIYRISEYDNGEITYQKVKFFITSNSFENAIASIEIEDTTDKIIAFAFPKECINQKQTIFLQYVKYLELEEFQDWKEINQELQSNSAGVKITSREENGTCYISLVPLE